MFCLNFDNSFVPGFIVSFSELRRASAVNTRALVAFAVGSKDAVFANIQLLDHCQVVLSLFLALV